MLEFHLWLNPIRAKVQNLQEKENERLIRWNVQANRLQLLCVEVKDEGHVGMQKLMVTSAIRQDQA